MWMNGSYRAVYSRTIEEAPEIWRMTWRQQLQGFFRSRPQHRSPTLIRLWVVGLWQT
jgi:hypothetical protein